MNVLSLLKFITEHPLNKKNKLKAILRFLKWQFGSRLITDPIIYSFTERSKLIIKKGIDRGHWKLLLWPSRIQ